MEKMPQTRGKRNGPLSIMEKLLLLRRTGPKVPLIAIKPEDNVLLGFPAIAEYLGIKSWATLYQWVEIYAFPAVKRPDGMWMTTITAIDQWLWMAAEADNDVRPNSRGWNNRVDIALRRLQSKASKKNQAAPPDEGQETSQS